MRPVFFVAPATLQLLMVAAGFCVRLALPQGGELSFDILALVPPFLCYVVALYSAPFLMRRHPALRFAASAPVALIITTMGFFALKLLEHALIGPSRWEALG